MNKLLLFISILISNWCFSQNIQFDSLMIKCNKLEKDENYELAKKLIANNIKYYPNNWFVLSKEQIYINEKLLMFEDNLSIFKEGHTKGYFYLIHSALPKYKEYKNLHGFDSIAKVDQLLRNETMVVSQTIYEVELPDNFTQQKPYPLCFIFHGGGSCLERVKEHWHSSTLNSNYIKVYLQSYRHYDSNTFGWRSGDSISDEDIKEILIELQSKYSIDNAKILVAGISAGGTYAIDVALRQVIPVNGFVTFCSGIPSNITADLLKSISKLEISGFLVGGDNDYYLPKQKQLAEILSLAGNRNKHLIVSNMGHQYPDNEDYYINLALNFINDSIEK